MLDHLSIIWLHIKNKVEKCGDFITFFLNSIDWKSPKSLDFWILNLSFFFSEILPIEMGPDLAQKDNAKILDQPWSLIMNTRWWWYCNIIKETYFNLEISLGGEFRNKKKLPNYWQTTSTNNANSTRLKYFNISIVRYNFGIMKIISLRSERYWN